MENRLGATAKISRPRPSKILPRHRLFGLLDSGLLGPVTWISGPAGSGKTALAASYLDARNLPCLWYQVDEGDDDVEAFFNCLGNAAGKSVPGGAGFTRPINPKHAAGWTAFTRKYFEDFFGGLYAEVARPTLAREECHGAGRPSLQTAAKGPGFVVVFDNYQSVPEGSLFHEIVNIGLSTVPEGIHVIVLSRHDPPSFLARMTANGEISRIGWDKIRFTPEESREIIGRKMKAEISARQLSRICARTEGWAAGLVLIADNAHVEDIDDEGLESLARWEIFEYFAVEVFEKEDREIKDFLLLTSYPPEMTFAMAEDLNGNSEARGILHGLIRRNCFIGRYFSRGIVFRYHNLFRDFLMARAGETQAPGRLALTRRKAARALEDDGQIDGALELYLAARDWRDAARLILVHAPGLMARGKGRMLQAWIESIPENIREEEWIVFWLGRCRLASLPEEGLDFFEKALDGFRRGKNARGMYLSLLGISYSFDSAPASRQSIDRWIAQVEKTLEEYPFFRSLGVEAEAACCMLHIIAMRKPRHPNRENWLARAGTLLRQTGNIDIKTRICSWLVFHGMLKGDFGRAAIYLSTLRESAGLPEADPLACLMLKTMESFYYWITARFEESRDAVTEALEMSAATGIHVFDKALLAHGAAGALSQGNPAGAADFLKRMVFSGKSVGLWDDEALCHYVAAWDCMPRREMDKAAWHAEQAVILSNESGSLPTGPFSHVAKALVMHELGESKIAMEHLAKAQEIGKATRSSLVAFTVFLARARFACERGEDGIAVESLGMALAIGREQGLVNSFFWDPGVMAKLCAKALEAGMEVDYVKDLIRRRDIIPTFAPLDCEPWPWPIKIFTLGRFGLLKEGRPMQFSKKSPQKPLSMLKALIAHGGREVSERKICDALWPEADGDAAHNAFTSTLHRLRRVIAHDKAIVLRDGRITLDSRYCWVDIWALERLLGRIREGEKANELKKCVCLIEKAIALYKGPFLGEGEGEEWALSAGERLSRKFLRAVAIMGDHLEKAGRQKKAVELYEKGLEADDLAEELYQRLMICYQELGLASEALQVYRRCHRTLASRLGIDPSPRTRSIYENIPKPECPPRYFGTARPAEPGRTKKVSRG